MSAEESRFDLIIFGSEATGQELEKIAGDLSVLLKITNERAKQLLGTPVGKAVAKNVALEVAEPVRDVLLKIGVNANIRPTKPSVKLELVEIEKNKFFCPACGYQYIFEDNQPPIEVCGNCGVVLAKYEKAQREKEERERIRNLLLTQHQSRIEAERIQREAEEAKFRRKRFEEELRKQLGVPKIINNRGRLISTAVLVHVTGIVLGIGTIYIYNMVNRPISISSYPHPQGGVEYVLHSDIMAQMMVDKMLTATQRYNSVTTSTIEPLIQTPIESQTLLAFLDNKLLNLKTDAEWDQHILIKIDALLAKGSTNTAIQLLDKIRNIALRFDRGGRLIKQLWNRNQNAEANQIYQNLVYTGERLTGGPLARIEALCTIAHHLNAAGYSIEANTILQKVRTVASAIIDSIDSAVASSEIAALMTVLGREEDARFLFSAAINTLEEIQDPAQQLLGIARIAPSYAAAGYRSSALHLLEDVVHKGSSIANAEERAQALEKLAEVSIEMSDTQLALAAIQQIPNINMQEQAIYNMITVMTRNDQLAQAMDLATRLKTPIYKALAFGFLGLNQQRQTTYQNLAQDSFAQAQQAANTIANSGEKSVVMSQLGRFFSRSGDETNANKYFAESKQLLETLTTPAEKDRALAILAINKAQALRLNEAQTDITQIQDANVRGLVVNEMSNR